METVVRKFNSFEEADLADVAEDLLSTPEQRINIVLELQAWYQPDAHSQRFTRVYRITELERS